MRDYMIVSDATLDLPVELVEEIDIHVIPMAFVIGEEEYQHYPDERNMSNEEFYQRLKNGEMPVTSQVNPLIYEEVFRKILEQDKDIICLPLTSGLSGTYQSALIAVGMLKEEFPNHKIYVLDSLCASAGLGFLVYHMVKKKQEGMDIDALRDWVLTNRFKIGHWFTVDDLFHLKRGGRLSSVEAVVGSALQIKPILSVDEEGKLYVENKLRGSKKSMDYLVNKSLEKGDDITNQVVMVAHGAAEERVLELKRRMLEQVGVKEVIVTKIGPIIGTHTGVGMLALVFMEK